MPEAIRDENTNTTMKVDSDGAAYVKVISQTDYSQRIENDVDGRPIYVGEANPGATTSASTWRIKKIGYTTGFVTGVTWANGTNKFTNKWDDRGSTGYTYS